jgi:methanogenic corrinoid protein MtbC1
VTCLTEGNPSEIIRISKTNWFTAVGFSISVQERLAPLSNLIRETRKSSRNKNMFVLVGGRCILDNPDRVHEVGADGTAVDGREAISQIQTMIKAAANQG